MKNWIKVFAPRVVEGDENSLQSFLDDFLSSDTREIKKSHIINGIYYAAVKISEDKYHPEYIKAVIIEAHILDNKNSDSYSNLKFCISEEGDLTHCECSEDILALLSNPVTKKSRVWREACKKAYKNADNI